MENQCMALIWMVFSMLYIIGGYISALILTLFVSIKKRDYYFLYQEHFFISN